MMILSSPTQRVNCLKACLTLLFCLFIAGCQIESDPKSELDKIRDRGVLRVGTLNNQVSYYIGPNGPTDLDYELAKRFADQLGVRLEMKPAYRLSGLFPALKNNEIDIIAAGLSQTPERIKSYRAAPAYYYVSQQLVYKAGTGRPKNLKQLIAKQKDSEKQLTVVSQSIFVKTLTQAQQEYPELAFNTDHDSDTKELLQRVSTGELAYTMANSVELSLTQRLYPDIAVAFELTEDQPISWFMRKADDESLYALLIEFFGDTKQSGELDTLEEKYFGHVDSFDYVDTRAFIRALDSKLAQWEPLFRQYANDFDWRLIAALSYQESHWNPKAISPTGVRGMMMLTLPTAKLVGVKNRLDPEQSIRGGADYLRGIVKRVPDSIAEHEKIWFALASYNIGFGHMMDARRLTKSQGANPDSWADVKDRLPLLQKKKYYSQTRYGYARGNEAKGYVENIRRYYQSIIGHVEKRAAATLDVESDIEQLQRIDIPLPPQTGEERLTQPTEEQSTNTPAATDAQAGEPDKKQVQEPKSEEESKAKASENKTAPEVKTGSTSEENNDKQTGE